MKRLLTFILGLVALLFLSSTSVAAQESNWVDSDYAPCLEAAINNGDVCSPAYVSHSNTSIMNDYTRKILGPVPGVTVTTDAWERNPEYVQKMKEDSAFSGVGHYIASMFANPPASTYAFLLDAGQSLGFIPKQTYAQGVGFSGLAPLLPLWKTFRNIAYGLLALIMIFIGFMVMLRKKIDPKTVVTVQNALPRIVVTLLLITFSYAIVGILIDLMYFLIFLVVSVFQQSQLLPDYAVKDIAVFTSGSLPRNVGIMPEGDIPWRVLVGIDPQGYGGALSIGAGILGTIIGAIVGNVQGAVIGAGLGFSFAILSLLISLGMLFLIIKLFFLFFGAYINIIIALITAPFQILTEAIPGGTGFSSWIKNLASNLIVFPIGALMFLLANVFMKLSSGSQPLWHPPYAELWVNNTTSIGTLIALGLLFSIPTIVNQAREAFKTKPVVDAGIGGIGGVFSQPISLIMQGSQFYLHKRQMDAFREGFGVKKQQSGNPQHG